MHLLRNNRIILFILVTILWMSAGMFFGVHEAKAATGGQSTLYFHSHNSDSSGTNADSHSMMSLGPPMETTMTQDGGGPHITPDFLGTPPCELVGTSGGAGGGNIVAGVEDLRIDIDSGTAGDDICVGTFYGLPVGGTLNIETTDVGALTAILYYSAGDKDGDQFMRARFYKFTEPSTYVIFGTLTDASTVTPMTTGSITITGTPGVNVTINPDDRIVVLWSLYLQSLDATPGNDVINVRFDTQTDAPSRIVVNYTYSTPNRPDLTQAEDDDFDETATTTACSTSGVSYGTSPTWTCLSPSGGGEFNAHSDSSEWIWINNIQGGTVGTNFSTTPSNVYIYQAMPNGDAQITTVMNSPVHGVGSTPFTNGGLLLWASNTDYLILQVHINAGTPTTQVNEDGTLISTGTLMADDWGRVWLRWTKTGTSYQASMSTDGVAFEDVGIARTNVASFTRTGLTVYSVNTDTEYGAAFEFFDVELTSVPNAPQSLELEGQPTPPPITGVTDLTPEFSAIYDDDNTSDTASAYRIEVNTQADFEGTVMWDSGTLSVAGLNGAPFNENERIPNTGCSGSSCISYAGTALDTDGSTYFWRIAFEDAAGNPGAVSATVQFTMASGGGGPCACSEFMIESAFTGGGELHILSEGTFE